MIKAFRLLAVCTISIGLAPIASAQTYKTFDFPGAIAITLGAGPNPQGTSVGTYTDASGVIHGFVLPSKGAFTAFDPPGSTLTTPGFIRPLGDIVGAFVDSSGVSHGFILSGANTQTLTSQVRRHRSQWSQPFV